MGLSFKNVLLVSTLEELPELDNPLDPNAMDIIAFLEDDLTQAYIFRDGEWSPQPIAADLSAAWPVNSLATFVCEKDPGDLLGFGKWECIKKEEIGKDVAYSWKRLE